ncbi:amidohydrolase family protein [Ramlibacter sp.]|uniref:amidohydrolase family protein n=1 Tax=Ramlibacter sp. TaxID=1917967 RepID=UPI003D148B8E
MPATPALDVSVRPMPLEIAQRYARLPEYRHIFDKVFGRPEVMTDGISLPAMQGEMDAHNVRQILVSGADSRRVNGLHVENDWVASLMRDMPGRVVGGVGLDMTRPLMELTREIERCVGELGFSFVKLFPYSVDMAPHDRRFYPIYAKCCELDVPVWTQVGHTAGLMPSEPGRPIHLDRVALDFPDLRIVGGHIGWPWEQEMIAMALKHPNVYVSTCGHAPDHWPEAFVQFLKTRGKRKVVFGSNWPYISYDRYFEKFAELGLAPETEQLFLRDNLLRVLGPRFAARGAAQ